jgi:hypothetical protein
MYRHGELILSTEKDTTGVRAETFGSQLDQSEEEAGEYDFPEVRCASGMVPVAAKRAASRDSNVAPPQVNYFDILKQYDASEIDRFLCQFSPPGVHVSLPPELDLHVI